MLNKRQMLAQSTAHPYVRRIIVIVKIYPLMRLHFSMDFFCNTNRIHSVHDCAVRPLCNTFVMGRSVVTFNVTWDCNCYIHIPTFTNMLTAMTE